MTLNKETSMADFTETPYAEDLYRELSDVMDKYAVYNRMKDKDILVVLDALMQHTVERVDEEDD